MTDRLTRLANASLCLRGLHIGDAFGEQFFLPSSTARNWVSKRRMPPKEIWHYTDDTAMALSIVQVLNQHGAIQQDALAASFGEHFEIKRDYGSNARKLLASFGEGRPWREATAAAFKGEGSYGNGGAMRVAPIGAWFHDDLELVAGQATLSCEVTHTHAEAIAGSVAIAVAAALALQHNGTAAPSASDLLQAVHSHIPQSDVAAGVERAIKLGDVDTAQAGEVLGNGRNISAQDTVPFTLWCAAHYLSDFDEALWQAVSVLGDRDTNCAIVGGIVACFVGEAGIGPVWRQHAEPLPAWPFDVPSTA